MEIKLTNLLTTIDLETERMIDERQAAAVKAVHAEFERPTLPVNYRFCRHCHSLHLIETSGCAVTGKAVS